MIQNELKKRPDLNELKKRPDLAEVIKAGVNPLLLLAEMCAGIYVAAAECLQYDNFVDPNLQCEDISYFHFTVKEQLFTGAAEFGRHRKIMGAIRTPWVEASDLRSLLSSKAVSPDVWIDWHRGFLKDLADYLHDFSDKERFHEADVVQDFLMAQRIQDGFAKSVVGQYVADEEKSLKAQQRSEEEIEARKPGLLRQAFEYLQAPEEGYKSLLRPDSGLEIHRVSKWAPNPLLVIRGLSQKVTSPLDYGDTDDNLLRQTSAAEDRLEKPRTDPFLAVKDIPTGIARGLRSGDEIFFLKVKARDWELWMECLGACVCALSLLGRRCEEAWTRASELAEEETEGIPDGVCTYKSCGDIYRKLHRMIREKDRRLHQLRNGSYAIIHNTNHALLFEPDDNAFDLTPFTFRLVGAAYYVMQFLSCVAALEQTFNSSQLRICYIFKGAEGSQMGHATYDDVKNKKGHFKTPAQMLKGDKTCLKFFRLNPPKDAGYVSCVIGIGNGVYSVFSGEALNVPYVMRETSDDFHSSFRAAFENLLAQYPEPSPTDPSSGNSARS